jgi:hypothetical protein
MRVVIGVSAHSLTVAHTIYNVVAIYTSSQAPQRCLARRVSGGWRQPMNTYLLCSIGGSWPVGGSYLLSAPVSSSSVGSKSAASSASTVAQLADKSERDAQ